MLIKNTYRHSRLRNHLAGFVLFVLLLSATLPALAAVGLTYFEALPGTGSAQVIIRWGTETETDTVGFRVKRSTEPLVQSATTVATLPGLGSATSGAEYAITDSGLAVGQTYYYWLFELLSWGEENVLTQGVQVVAPGGSPAARRYYLPVLRHSF